MRRILAILFLSLIVPPAVCSACSLCTYYDTMIGDLRDNFLRWDPATIQYSCASDLGRAFTEKLDSAITEWKSAAQISFTSDGCTWYVDWDYDNTPTDEAANTTVSFDPTTGKISSSRTTFYGNLSDAAWNWQNSCAGWPSSVNMYKVMLHEIGHAIGFSLPYALNPGVDPHPAAGSESVMEQGSCYTCLGKTDLMYGLFLYPANPASHVAYFSPVLRDGGVVVKWQSKYEYETSHFFVERRMPSGSFSPISDPIIAQGDSHAGARYEFIDPAGIRSDLYRLIEVEKNGVERELIEKGVALAEPAQKPLTILPEAERARLTKVIAATVGGEAPAQLGNSAVGTGSGIEWLAIYPLVFEEAIDDLVAYRNYHGLNAGWVSYEWIVANYGSMKSYLQHLWSSQGNSLKYVLLVGDATLIPIDLCQDGDIGGYYAEYYTDAILTDIDNDWFPEVSIGRIPAGNSDEVLLYVAKVLEYEGQVAADWNKDMTFFIHDVASPVDLDPMVVRLAAELAALVTPPRTMHYMSLGEYRDECARHTVGMAEFDSGRGVVIGFGARASAYDFVHWLTTDAVDPSCSFSGTQLAENHKCAFVLGASCDMGDMLHTYTP